MEKLTLLKNLMLMATADGKVTPEELDYLQERSARWRISEQDFQDAMIYANSADAEIELPESVDDRKELLRGFVELMGADGDYADTEMMLFAIAAQRFGIGADQLNRLIDQVLDGDDLVLGDE